MKIKLIDYKEIDKEIKNLILFGLFFSILSAIIVFTLLVSKHNIILFIIYLVFNFTYVFVSTFKITAIIEKYKNEVIKLNAVKEIIDNDKSYLFKRINYLEKELKKAETSIDIGGKNE